MKFTIDTVTDSLHIQSEKDEKFLESARKAIEAIEAEMSDYQTCEFHSRRNCFSPRDSSGRVIDLDRAVNSVYNSR